MHEYILYIVLWLYPYSLNQPQIVENASTLCRVVSGFNDDYKIYGVYKTNDADDYNENDKTKLNMEEVEVVCQSSFVRPKVKEDGR